MNDAASGPAFATGYRLDRYELLCPIASGGMASVWLARLLGKRGFEKLVAIKTIHTELIKDPRYQEMFLDEARIASGIEHPNVAQIIDLGEQHETLYIVMEWVDGESLARIEALTQKRTMTLPIELCLRVMADVCAGLHAAHELRDVRGGALGVVHRDVSPQNIVITTAGTVKVIDFGIAKAHRRSAGETQAGTLKGKIRYMAPEQVNGHPTDRRADIWAVGMCLHELISGREPFDELSDIDVMRRLMSDDPAPRFDSAELPPPVRQIFERSLVANVNRRFDDANAMRRALENAIAALGLSATSEDVADFVRTNFADLAQRRREVVTKAVAAADDRAAPAGSKASRPSGMQEIALAPTQVVASAPAKEHSTTGGATLSDQLEARPSSQRRVAIAGAVAVVAIVLLIGGPVRSLLVKSPAPDASALPVNATPPSSSGAPEAIVVGAMVTPRATSEPSAPEPKTGAPGATAPASAASRARAADASASASASVAASASASAAALALLASADGGAPARPTAADASSPGQAPAPGASDNAPKSHDEEP